MKIPYPTRTRLEGFTLVEVVITVLLITVVMVPVTRLSYTVIRSTQYARDLGEALAAGQTQMERFEDMDFDSITTGSATSGAYNLDWTVTTVDGNKVVEMEVTWEILGTDLSIDLNTVYSPETSVTYNLP